MPLLIEDKYLETFESSQRTDAIYEAHPILMQEGVSFRGMEPERVDGKGLLYVYQREFAVSAACQTSVIEYIGSDDATTCQIVILRHTSSGVTGLAHCDGSGVRDGLTRMFKKLRQKVSDDETGRYEIDVIGGFADDRGYSETLAMDIMKVLQEQNAAIHVRTLCVCRANDVMKNEVHWPAVTAVAVNLKSGHVFPAYFPDKSPDLELRGGRVFASRFPKMLDIYDDERGEIVLEPFTYNRMKYAELWAAQSDNFIRQNFSTSPELEGPHFAESTRKCLRFIHRNPSPEVTLFPNNAPRIYKKERNTGNWLLSQTL